MNDLKRLSWREQVLLTLGLVAAIALSLGRVPEVGTQPLGAASDARSQGHGSLVEEPTWNSPDGLDAELVPAFAIDQHLSFQAEERPHRLAVLLYEAAAARAGSEAEGRAP